MKPRYYILEFTTDGTKTRIKFEDYKKVILAGEELSKRKIRNTIIDKY